jgi:NitT/TauT family transport system ATP-binding protein
MGLEIIGLCKFFEDKKAAGTVHVLDHLDYHVHDGRFLSIVGPSGCGKTTLLRIIAGLEKPSSGNLLLDGRKMSYDVDRIGLVFQEYALFPWRTTLENVELGLEMMDVPRKERRTAAMEYIRSFGLNDFENKYPHELSGGMQQRVAIARTLITDPKLVLMDEPFGSLDSQTRNNLQAFLLELWQKQKVSIIFVTHNVDEAVFLSDEVLVFSKRPARIVDHFEITATRPRERTSAECNQMRKRILDALEAERAS